MTTNYKFKQHTILSNSETYELIIRWQTEGCIKSRNKLLVHNLRFISKVASALKSLYHYVPVDDLVGYGVEGFLNSLDKFDVSSGKKLITYAVHWIRQNIQRKSEDCETTIRYPANIREEIRKAVKGDYLTQEQQGIIDNYLGNQRGDDVIGDDNNSNMTLADKYAFINHSKYDLVDEAYIQNEMHGNLQLVLSGLSPIQKQVVIHLFGFNDMGEMNLRQVASNLGISHEHVRKIRESAISDMRESLRRIYA